jgi:hypothetical protein
MAPDEWRPLMPRVREVAAKLADRGELSITQKGKPVDARTARGAIRLALPKEGSPSAYADAYRGIDFRKEPERYRVGRGEQGVLIAEPYKSELLPLWRFKTPEVARASSVALWKAFVAYRRARDYVGMDMAQKFLQMGFTRARRYANHRSGRKYDASHRATARDPDPVKAASAAVFYEVWQRAERDRTYRAWRESRSTRITARTSRPSTPRSASTAAPPAPDRSHEAAPRVPRPPR